MRPAAHLDGGIQPVVEVGRVGLHVALEAARAEHGPSAIEPIEIAVQAATTQGAVEIAVGGVVVRCGLGADVAYVASLVHALRG